MCRLLKAEEIECRVSQVSAKGCSLLLYKTARVDRAILDEEFGCLNWQNDFKVIDGKMYGGIGVSRNNNGVSEWVWKWDCGTESNTEAEKGQASDCFKRAGFKWGIGIELYSTPFIWINCDTYKDEYASKNAKKDVYKLTNKFEKFDVKSIDYDTNRNINKLVIVDSKGNTVYELGKYISKKELEPINLTEPMTESEEQDLDIYLGLESIEDMENLKIYYTQNKDKVSDIKELNKKVNAKKKQLGGKNE